MTPQEIRIEIYKLWPDINQSTIARSLDVTPQAVQNTITRKLVSRRIAVAIAEAIGRPIEYVFPDVFLKSQKKRSA